MLPRLRAPPPPAPTHPRWLHRLEGFRAVFSLLLLLRTGRLLLHSLLMISPGPWCTPHIGRTGAALSCTCCSVPLPSLPIFLVAVELICVGAGVKPQGDCTVRAHSSLPPNFGDLSSRAGVRAVEGRSGLLCADCPSPALPSFPVFSFFLTTCHGCERPWRMLQIRRRAAHPSP